MIERVLGNIAAQAEDNETALKHFANSLTILQDLEREPDLGHVLREYALVLIKQGLPEQASDKLVAAKTIFERLDLQEDLNKTQALLYQLDQDK